MAGARMPRADGRGRNGASRRRDLCSGCRSPLRGGGPCSTYGDPLSQMPAVARHDRLRPSVRRARGSVAQWRGRPQRGQGRAICSRTLSMVSAGTVGRAETRVFSKSKRKRAGPRRLAAIGFPGIGVMEIACCSAAMFRCVDLAGAMSDGRTGARCLISAASGSEAPAASVQLTHRRFLCDAQSSDRVSLSDRYDDAMISRHRRVLRVQPASRQGPAEALVSAADAGDGPRCEPFRSTMRLCWGHAPQRSARTSPLQVMAAKFAMPFGTDIPDTRPTVGMHRDGLN